MWKEGLLQVITVFGGLKVSSRWIHTVLVTVSAVTDFVILFDFQFVTCQSPNKHGREMSWRTVWNMVK